MRYYILDEHNVVVNTIVLEEGTDPAIFGAIADDRVFNIGDTWTPPATEAQILGREITELQLTQLEGGKANV